MQPATRQQHFKNLNTPAEIGTQWQIHEEEYDDALDSLPPLRYRVPGTRGGFALREFWKDSITHAFFKTADGRFFCRWIDYSQPPAPFVE